MKRISKPGIYQLSAEDYHADPCAEFSLSSGFARTILKKTPRHAFLQSSRLNPDYVSIDNKTFDIGRAAHSAVLGNGGDYVEIPADLLSADGGVRTKVAKEWVENARDNGLTPLVRSEIDQINNMAGNVLVSLAAMGITLDPARSELTAIAQIGGVWCRAMIDHAPIDPTQPLYDLKTSVDLSDDYIMRSIMNYGYDIQAAHYIEAWKAATGECREFVFIFVEKSSPNECRMVKLGANTLHMASRKIRRAREITRICLEKNNWPAYPKGVITYELPEFFHAKWEERESVEDDIKQRTGMDALEYYNQSEEQNPWE